MSNHISFWLVAAALVLSVAATYPEGGTDAGDLPATAQLISTPLNNGITAITGQTVFTNGLSDSDMYGFTLSSPGALTLAATGFAPGANNFDTPLAVFNANGTGVAANALIFPNFTDGTTDPSATVGPVSMNNIAGYTGSSNEAGAFGIGPSFVPDAVPASATLFHAAALDGLAGWTILSRQRNCAA